MKSIKVTVMSKKRLPVFQGKINRGDTAELADKTVMTKKGRQFFSAKDKGDTLSCAPPSG